MFRAEKNEEEIAKPGVTCTVRDSVRSGTLHQPRTCHHAHPLEMPFEQVHACMHALAVMQMPCMQSDAETGQML